MNMNSVAFKKYGGKIKTEVTRILHKARENYITILNTTHTHKPYGVQGRKFETDNNPEGIPTKQFPNPRCHDNLCPVHQESGSAI